MTVSQYVLRDSNANYNLLFRTITVLLWGFPPTFENIQGTKQLQHWLCSPPVGCKASIFPSILFSLLCFPPTKPPDCVWLRVQTAVVLFLWCHLKNCTGSGHFLWIGGGWWKKKDERVRLYVLIFWPVMDVERKSRTFQERRQKWLYIQ